MSTYGQKPVNLDNNPCGDFFRQDPKARYVSADLADQAKANRAYRTIPQVREIIASVRAQMNQSTESLPALLQQHDTLCDLLQTVPDRTGGEETIDVRAACRIAAKIFDKGFIEAAKIQAQNLSESETCGALETAFRSSRYCMKVAGDMAFDMYKKLSDGQFGIRSRTGVAL